MLTTATILMSLGAEPGNLRHVASGGADTAGISFAKSFGERVDLADAVQTPVVDGRNLKDAVGAESAIPAKGVGLDFVAARVGAKFKADGSAGDKISSEFSDVKDFVSPTSAKDMGSISGVVVVPATGGILHSGKSKENIPAAVPVKIRVEMPDGQVSDVNVKCAVQKPMQASDGIAPDASDTPVAPELDVKDPIAQAPSIPGNGEKPVIQDQKQMLIAAKNQEAVPIQKLVKDHDGAVKTGKGAKAEEKTEKPEKIAGTTANAIGSEVQTVVAVPVIVLPADGQQHGLNATPDVDAVTSAASTAAGRNVGMTAITQVKVDRKASATGKPNEDKIETTVAVLADAPDSKKTEIDTAKATPSEAKAMDNAKAQSATQAVTGIGQPHGGTAASGVVFGGAGSVAAAHVIVATPHATHANSYAEAIQGGSGVIDTGASLDTTHRTLAATPTTLEVGVANGTHGWLKIRAEMTGGGVVNASLSTATSSGQEMLHRELPSLTAYLQSERVAVNTVVVQTAVPVGTDSRQLSGGMNGDGRGQAQQSGGQGGENRQNTASVVLNRADENRSYNSLSGVGGDDLLSSASYAGGGSWLSVRA